MAADRVSVDLNSDVGESFGRWGLGDDAGVLDHVSSANIACGFHAGDPRTARRTCDLAAARGVVIGAHVGYRDLAGFGRRFLDVEPDELTDEVVYQVGALQALAHAAGSAVRYVKPHGALYNTVAHHPGQAAAVVHALVQLGGGLPLVVLPGSVVEQLARSAGLRTVGEVFADRAYTGDATLVPRGTPGAVLHDPDVIARRVVRMVTDGVVVSVDGAAVPVAAETVCVHGDSPEAVAVAAAVRRALDAAGLDVTGFVPA